MAHRDAASGRDFASSEKSARPGSAGSNRSDGSTRSSVSGRSTASYVSAASAMTSTSKSRKKGRGALKAASKKKKDHLLKHRGEETAFRGRRNAEELRRKLDEAPGPTKRHHRMMYGCHLCHGRGSQQHRLRALDHALKC